MNMDPIDNEYGPDAPSAAGSDCEPDPEEPTEHEANLLEPLGLAFGALAHLTRLRLRGVTPFGSLLADLPLLQVQLQCVPQPLRRVRIASQCV